MLEENDEKSNSNVLCLDEGIRKRELVNNVLTQEHDINKMKIEKVKEIMNEYISKDLGKVVETKEEAKSDDTVNSNVSVISNNLNE